MQRFEQIWIIRLDLAEVCFWEFELRAGWGLEDRPVDELVAQS